MMKRNISFFVTLLLTVALSAQDSEFNLIISLPATPVKNQYKSNTCWSFASVSFLESELIRMGKGTYDLSEMFVVKYIYIEKARKYVRLHGNMNFSGGGEFTDGILVMKKYGLIPEEVYSGKNIGEQEHIHGEMDEVLKYYVDAIIKNKNDKLSPVWAEGYEMVLNAYLGNSPGEFIYKGKKYTPESFVASLGLKADNFIQISSFLHHPYYSKFILEVPDNWAWGEYYNLPLEEMKEVVEYALHKGYTLGWAGDITENNFSYIKGVAELSAEMEISVITAQLRQEQFDNYQTTDDHGMHITGIAKNKEEKNYYYMKNSWGSGTRCNGYIYMSENYLLLKTTGIMLNKEALPKHIADKIGIKIK